MKATIIAKGTQITVLSKVDENDYISLTDIARYKNPDEPKDVVKNWMRSRSTIEFLGLWEKLNNPDFKGVEFDSFIHEAGANAFTLSPLKWISATNAIGVISKSGRSGGTYPKTKGNMRDEATIQQLIILSNLESMNAELIKQNIPQDQRLAILNKMAIEQMTSILGCASMKQMGGGSDEE